MLRSSRFVLASGPCACLVIAFVAHARADDADRLVRPGIAEVPPVIDGVLDRDLAAGLCRASGQRFICE